MACLRITSYVCFFLVFVLMSIFILTTTGNATAMSQQSSPKGGKSSDSVFLSVDITEKFKYFCKASEMSKGLSWWDQQKRVIKMALSSQIAKKKPSVKKQIYSQTISYLHLPIYVSLSFFLLVFHTVFLFLSSSLTFWVTENMT